MMSKLLHRHSFFVALFILGFILLGSTSFSQLVFGQSTTGATHAPLDNFQGHPPIHINRHSTSAVVGLSPQQLYPVYHLTGSGGTGTIAIIDAYDDANAQSDLAKFSS